MYRHRLRPLFAGLIAISFATPANASGSLTMHMASHIVLMNALAPIIALTVIAWMPQAMTRSGKSMLAAATVAQIVILWTAHAPVMLAFSVAGTISHAVVQLALFLAALWFWFGVFGQSHHEFWRAIFALLITGKLFCLLGALLVFAPRVLYPFSHSAQHPAESFHAVTTDDQQLAGLLMLLACPLSYVLAGIFIASRALRALESPDYLGPSSTRESR